MPATSVDQLLGRLAKGKPVPGILLLGGEVYLRDLCRAKLIEAFVPEGARDWGVSCFSAADESVDRVIAQAQTLPMLVPRQLVFVTELEAVEKLGDDARESAVQRLLDYLDDPAPFTVLVLQAAALDKRMSLFKKLSQKTLLVSLELGDDPQERASLAARMAVDMARNVGAELLPDAAEELADVLNADLTAIHTEIEKLCTYVGERRKITRADVQALVISAKKYSVWQLSDVLATRQRSRALEFLDSVLREGEPAPQVVGAMAWMYRKLIQAQELTPRLPVWQAARDLGVRAETAELALRQARKIPRRQLLDGLQALYEADSRLKSGVADPRAVMEFLVAQLTANSGSKP